MIELTVGLPMFRAKDTAWLALESLCRQEGVDFEWELVICEEQDDKMFGRAATKKYMDDLFMVGCVKKRYIAFNEWMPLSQKWRIIGQHANPDSKVFCLCGADDWNSPNRLAEAYDMIMNHGADWTQTDKGYYYYLPTKEVVKFDGTTYFRGMVNPLMQKSLRTEYMRNLPDEDKTNLVDTWLMHSVIKQNNQAYFLLNNSDDWQGSMFTYGGNAISAREQEIIERQHPFYYTDTKLGDIIPERFIKRLDDITLYKDSERIGGGWKP